MISYKKIKKKNKTEIQRPLHCRQSQAHLKKDEG